MYLPNFNCILFYYFYLLFYYFIIFEHFAECSMNLNENGSCQIQKNPEYIINVVHVTAALYSNTAHDDSKCKYAKIRREKWL